MSEIGSLKVNLECDSDEFMAKMTAARAALEGVAKAADEATAALARLYGVQHVTVSVDDIAGKSATITKLVGDMSVNAVRKAARDGRI